jgi:hypothetical protein
VKKDYKILLFNDIIVIIDPITVKKKHKEPKDIEQWPCELVWIEKKKDNMIKINGPCRSVIINCGTPEVFDKWLQNLTQVIDKRLEYTQTHLKDANFIHSSMNLGIRFGTAKFKDGAIYKGWWDRGSMQGRGIYEYLGSIYEGDFVGNIREGAGTYWYADGTVYRGDWKSGKSHGRGELITPNRDRYIGEWKDGKRSGQGEMFYINGINM